LQPLFFKPLVNSTANEKLICKCVLNRKNGLKKFSEKFFKKDLEGIKKDVILQPVSE